MMLGNASESQSKKIRFLSWFGHFVMLDILASHLILFLAMSDHFEML